MTKTLSGTFIVPLATVKETGNLLPLMALMLRAAGMEVLVLGTPQEAAALNIPYTEAETSVQLKTGGQAGQRWKHQRALKALQRGPVLWPDLEFAQWAGPDCNGIEGLTIVNLGALLVQGMRPVDTTKLPG